MVADIRPFSSLITAPHTRWFCMPCSINRPFDRWTLVMGEVRAPSTVLSTRCGTLIRKKGGTSASSAVLRSQSPFREHSTIELNEHSMGAEPSIGAARAGAGTLPRPTSITIPLIRMSARIVLLLSSLFEGVAPALEAGRVGTLVVVGLLVLHGVRLSALLAPAYAPDERAGGCADRGTLAGIAPDRAADRADGGPAPRSSYHLALAGGRGRLRRTDLLHRPGLALPLVLLLLLRALPARRVDVLGGCRVRQDCDRRGHEHTASEPFRHEWHGLVLLAHVGLHTLTHI